MTHSAKAIKHDLPIQVGFFVYQYAKLKMLAFYFDVIAYFIDRKDFCLLEMDTGKLDFGVNSKNLRVNIVLDAVY